MNISFNRGSKLASHITPIITYWTDPWLMAACKQTEGRTCLSTPDARGSPQTASRCGPAVQHQDQGAFVPEWRSLYGPGNRGDGRVTW